MSKAQRQTSRLWLWSSLINIESHDRRSGITLVFMIGFVYDSQWPQWPRGLEPKTQACQWILAQVRYRDTRPHSGLYEMPVAMANSLVVLPPLQGIWFTVSTESTVNRQTNLFSSALWVILGLWQRSSLPLWRSFWAFPVPVALVLRLLVRHEAVRQETLLCRGRILEEGKPTGIHTDCKV